MSIPSVSPIFKRAEQIRVLIAERNRMAGQLLGESLERDSRFQVVSVPPPAEIVSVATKQKPDVAVISADFDFAAKKGLQLARTLNTSRLGVRIVILLDLPQRESVIASFRSGARAVFCRTEPVSEFRTCVERVSRGEIWASSTEAEYLLEAVRSCPSCDGIGGDKLDKLSKREIEVAEQAVQGFTNKQIADQLRLSEHTVKNYLFRIFEKLGVSNRMELFFRLSNHEKDALYDAVLMSTKAAEEGFAAAQFALGLAHLEGWGVEKNEQSAYYWLRRAEKSAGELQERSRILIEELKSKMESVDLDSLEQRVAARNDSMVVNKHAASLITQYVKSLDLAG